MAHLVNVTLEILAGEQETTGEEIVRLARNYNKDSDSRKTASYLADRLEKLEYYWEKFDQTDSKIREEFSDQLEHPYFTKDYYESVRIVAYRLRTDINRRSLASVENTQATDAKKGEAVAISVERQDKVENKSTARNDKPPTQPRTMPGGMMDRGNRLQLLMDILQRSMEKSTLELAQKRTEVFCRIKSHSIQQNWDEISAIYWKTEAQEQAGVTERFFEMQEQVETVLVLLCEHATTPQDTATGVSTTLKLPKIELPKFDGSYLNWRQFYELFKQMIYDQPISPAQKLYYLRANVTGEAHNLIQHFQPTDDNFEAAWQTLVDRFDNKRLLLTAQLNKLLAQPPTNGTASSLRKLHDWIKEGMQAIINLGFEVNSWDPLVIHLMLQKLDKDSRSAFEQSLEDPRGSPTIKQFLTFVEARFQMLDAISSRDERKRPTVAVATSMDSSINCAMCNNGKHKIYNCSQFLYLSGDDRDKAVRRLQLCRNCLKPGHYSHSCQSRGCQKCNSKHNTLLHHQQKRHNRQQDLNNHQQREENGVQQSSQNPKRNHFLDKPSSSSANAATGCELKKRHVYLATAVVNVISSYGTRIPCRVLLDSGSQLHFVTTAFAQSLGNKKRRMDIPISGIGAQECKAEYQTTLTFESRTSRYKATVEASIMPRISEYQPSSEVEMPFSKIPAHIQLADPSFSKPQRIDMLLGADIFFELLMPGELKISNDFPPLRNTKLGWIVAGSSSAAIPTAHCHIATRPSLSSLEKLVRKFWETEGHDTPVNTLSREEHQCEQHFESNVEVTPAGRFIVRLPFKDEPGMLLGDSFEMARRRFLALERKLDKNSELKEAYVNFMNEYEKLGHMTSISEDTLPSSHYVLPHHCVLKPESSSTKLRVVFDASAKTTSGYSLNDVLMVGPTVQPDLFSVIINFRIPKYVFTGDITKMYRQVFVSVQDRPYQLILWRSHHKQPLQVYQMNTVTYGTASASYLATRCLVKLADDNQDKCRNASMALKRNIYVDDCLAGAETAEEAQRLLHEIIELLKSGNFELKKFCANDQTILDKIPDEDKEKLVTFHQSEVIKTLGLIWDPSLDRFQFSFELDNFNKANNQVCKRSVLADLARLFDPLGLLGPVILLGKLFLQELWKTNLAWDEILPSGKAAKWINYVEQFQSLSKLSIPRYVLIPEAQTIELHAFSDSSLNAFGSCVYIRSIDKNGAVYSQLLCSKSRVSPLKATSIARLELQGAVLMVELVERLINLLSRKVDKVFYYTDSTTVLAWLRAPSYTWETFVANRVAKIQAVTNTQQWNFIRGCLNPADLVSRGLSLTDLVNSASWFNGPEFLRLEEHLWPKAEYQITDDIPERRKVKSVLTTSAFYDDDIINRIHYKNRFYILQKIFARCHRFYSNCRKPKISRSSGQLSVEELQHGGRLIMLCTQRTAFSEDYRRLRAGINLSKNSSLTTLFPFLDEKSGLIRVGGRLRNASVLPDAKHQILMPKNHIVTKLLLDYLHQKHMHASHRALVAISRQQYWILSVGRMARQTIGNCIKCFRSKPTTMEQLMGSLPKERVNPSRPFYHTGVDFCGPVKTHHKIRGKTPTKSYLAVFVCFSTRAVHIEVVGDLTSEAFINALKRFIGRRGVCKTIFCDNATNFVGAKSELAELRRLFDSEKAQSTIQATCLQEGINWKFIPPRSPHFGGLWEAAVKSAKGLLVRHLGEASLTYEQLLTVVIQVEAILNSRPLTPMSADPNDLEALTPGHFLTGAPLTALPEPDVTENKLSNLNKFRQIQHIQQHFWNRWSAEYLHLLQQRMKWRTEVNNLSPGTLVIIKEANTPPMRWKLGRVVEVTKGDDELVRVASIKTQTGIYVRAVQNLCPLPIESGSEPRNEYAIEKNPKQDKEPPRHTRNLRSKTFSKGSLISIALLALMVLPTSMAQAHNDIVVKKLDDAVGIYFEDIGRIRTINTFWSVYIYYNLTAYWQEYGEIRAYLGQLNLACANEIAKHANCNPILEIIEHRMTVIEYNNELLHNFHSSKHDRSRMARSPFDIVGTLAHSLFGVLDQNDAKKIENDINSARENEHYLAELIRKQSSIADSTANILKRSSIKVQQQFEGLKEYLTKTINVLEENQNRVEATLNLASLTSYLTLLVTNFERVQDALLDVVLDLNHEKINPQLITPQQFGMQLQLIRNNLPTTLSLPSGTVIDMYKMATVKGRSLNESIIFEMQLPLTNTEIFQLFNLVALPILHRNSSYIVETSSSNLAVTLTRDKFFSLAETELASCKPLPFRNYLCTQTHPTALQRSNLHGCEMAVGYFL